MNHEMIIRRVAGTLTATSLVLGWLVHPAWLALAGFVALNLLQSSFTRFCPLESMLRWRETAQERGGVGQSSLSRGAWPATRPASMPRSERTPVMAARGAAGVGSPSRVAEKGGGILYDLGREVRRGRVGYGGEGRENREGKLDCQ